ncbi:transglycosylase SLT domain-containing protein [Streptomyces sannanensis]|uniref:Transglycosylase SLT domain-containing protein n=1 Tax=Streptomyces sannanensis TaxID=285536 RepID=A0ABP6S8V0_9ACTN
MTRSLISRFATRRTKNAAVGTAVLLGSVGGVFASTTSAAAATPQMIAKQMIGNSAQFQCFHNIVSRESSWNPHATNASSGAYGLVQALPASKMASAGADWKTNPKTQIKWGLNYMNSRYGSPCDAWKFWQKNNWY